jgi:YggT family protein
VFFFLAEVISVLANFLTILVFVTVLLSWFMSPYHPVREALDRLVEPLLAPVRRVVPMTGMFDLSPMIFMIVVQLLAQALVQTLRSLQ